MADTKLSALIELAATPAADDEVYIRDVSEAAADESKRITVVNLLGGILTPKVKAETRDMTAASGAVAYTGYGFQPSSLLIFTYLNTVVWTISWIRGTTEYAIYLAYTGAVTGIAAKAAYLISAADAYQQAVLTSMDADGFTLTWTKTGTPTGTAYMTVIAFK